MSGFGAFVIGDEILAGKRQDKHFPWLIEALARRGLRLAWCEHVGDERARISAALKPSSAAVDVGFRFGGKERKLQRVLRLPHSTSYGKEKRYHCRSFLRSI